MPTLQEYHDWLQSEEDRKNPDFKKGGDVKQLQEVNIKK